MEHTSTKNKTRGIYKRVTCFFCGVSGRWKSYRRLHNIIRYRQNWYHTVIVCNDCDAFVFPEAK